MIQITEGNKSFHFRAVGVIVKDDQVLLHRCVIDDFWSMPGGRCEFNESSKEAIIREMKEELDVKVEVERLLWVAECFFEDGGNEYHEMAFYYLLKLAEEDNYIYENKEPIEGDEEGLKLIFQWFAIDELEKLELYPIFLKEALQSLPVTIEHIIDRNY